MHEERSQPYRVLVSVRAALLFLLPLAAMITVAEEKSFSDETRVLRAELMAVGNHYVRIESFSGASGEIRIENRTRYALMITSGFENREDQIAPGGEGVWRCDRTHGVLPLSVGIGGGGTVAPLHTLAACGQRMRMAETQFPL